MNMNLIIEREMLYIDKKFIRKTCLSDISCFEIIISNSWECHFPKLLY